MSLFSVVSVIGGVTICDNLNFWRKGKLVSLSKILTATELAKYLRVHPYTVKRLAREGKLPGFKIGGQWRFDQKQIEAFKNSA